MENNIIENYKFIEIKGIKLFIMKSGLIFRYYNNKRWKLIENTSNTVDGYNQIALKNQMIKRHRLMGLTFLNFNIKNPKLQIDHIDGNRLNNHINNLRVVNHQQNQFNRTTAKGYYKDKTKWHSQIQLNKKVIYLGLYTTEEDARKAYLDAKLVYHII